MTSRNEEPGMEAKSLVTMMSNGLDRQRSLLEDLFRLAESQGRLIQSSEHDSLLSLVHERQAIVEQLVGIRSNLVEMAEKLRARAEFLSDQDRESLQLQIDETRELSRKVLAIDTQDVDSLIENRSSCQEKLAGITHTMNARRGYQSSGQSSPRYADAQG